MTMATFQAGGPALLDSGEPPHVALEQWIDLFVDFVATKQGLAAVVQSDDSCSDPLHSYFLEQLEPVCANLLRAAAEADEIRPDQDAYELMRGIRGLYAGESSRGYDARRLVELLVAGLRERPVRGSNRAR